jgi:hypothetical protein
VANWDAVASPRVPSPVGSGEDVTARAVLEVVEQVEKDFKPRNDLIKRTQDVLHGKIPIKVPPGFESVVVPARSPLPLHQKNTIVAALSVNPPTVNVKPLGFGDSWESNSTAREHFLEASWKRQEFEARRPIYRLFIDALVTTGEAVLKTVERTKGAWSGYESLSAKVLEDLKGEEWQRKSTDDRRKEYDRKTEEYKQQAPYPITTTDVLPETFFYVKSADGFTFCAERKQVPYYDTLARYGYGVARGGKIVEQAMALPTNEWSSALDGSNTIEMVECWTWKECHYILLANGQKLKEGTRVKTIKHGYGDPATKTLRGPYFHAHALSSYERLPHRAGMGLLYPFLDLYVLYDHVRHMRAVNGVRTAYAAYQDVTPPQGNVSSDAPFGSDGTEAIRGHLTITPGDVIPGDIRPIEQPKAGVDFNLFAEEIRRDLDLVVPSVLQGAVDTTESGWQLSQAVHLARLAWDPLVDNAERCLSERAGFESWVIEERIRERVYARGEIDKNGKSRSGYLSLGPDDLNGLHDVYEVKLDPELPSTQVVELRFHGEAVDRGFESKSDAISALGKNPDEVRKQRFIEEFQESAEMKQMIFDRARQLLGQRTKARLQDAGIGGTAPPPGTALAGMGNPMVPGQNMPMEPTPQAPGAPIPSAGVPTQPGQPPGSPANIPSAHLVPPGVA